MPRQTISPRSSPSPDGCRLGGKAHPSGGDPPNPPAPPDWACWRCEAANPAGNGYCGQCGAARRAEDPQDQQRLISALFADISGFTSLADTLDADQLHQVIAPVIGVLAGVAERYGGTLAKYAGDAVLVFFGAPVAQEDHATRALLCAEEMHRELVDALPRLPPEGRLLQLHVGVNSGHVVAGLFGGDVGSDIGSDYSILGDAVNVAQRLESVAPAGQTYVGDTTRQLASSEFDLEPLGELNLKGKVRPVCAWKLIGRRAFAPQRTSNRLPLVGRAEEMARLRAVLVGHGRGAVVAIEAEAGGGKTRVLEEIRDEAESAGALWLEARSLSYGSSVPYWPYIDLLRRSFAIRLVQDPQLAANQMAVRLAEIGLADAGPVFSRLLGLPSDAEHLAPEAFARELHRCFTALLSTFASRQPVVVALEDVHWADSASVDLTLGLAQLGSTANIVVLMTGRPESAEVMARIAERFPPTHRTRIDLGPLGRAAVAEVMGLLLAGTPADDFVELVRERTGGNPFFVSEFVRGLVDHASVELTGDRWSLRPDCEPRSLPMSIEGVLSARIDLLPRATGHALQMASVIGRQLDTALLSAVADDLPDLARILDRLVEAGMLDRLTMNGVEQLRFHHALVLDVAYSRLTHRQRRDLHRRVAEAAEVIYGTGDDVIDLLARHFYLAEAGVKAVDYLEKAAERSIRLFANEEAVVHLTRAIELTRSTERLASRLQGLLLRVADIEELIGDYDAAVRDFEEVRAAANDVRSWRGLASVYRKRGRNRESVELIDDALAGVGAADGDIALLWLERTATLVIEGRSAEAVASAQAGLRSITGNDVTVAAYLRLRMAQAEETLGHAEEALAHAEEARQMFESVVDLRGLSFAHRVVGGIQWRLGDPSAVGTLRRGLVLAEKTGSTEEIGGCLVNLGMALLHFGEVVEACTCDVRAIKLFTAIGNKTGEATAHANLAEKLLAAGDLQAASMHADRGLTLAKEIDSYYIAADAHRTIAQIQLAAGRPTTALVHGKEALKLFSALGDEGAVSEVTTLVDRARLDSRERRKASTADPADALRVDYAL